MAVRIGTGNQEITSVAWSPDGRYIFSVSPQCGITLWDVRSYEKITETSVRYARSVVFSPDTKRFLQCVPKRCKTTFLLFGKWPIYSSNYRRGDVHICGTYTGKSIQVLKGHKGDACVFAWSPDGRSVVTGGEDKTVRIWHAYSGKQQKICEGHESGVDTVEWSRSEAKVLSADCDHVVRIWNAVSGSLLHAIAYCGTYARWSPNGQQIASSRGCNDEVSIYFTSTGALHKKHDIGVFPVWSPEGKYIAATRQIGRHRPLVVRVYNIANEKMVKDLEGDFRISPIAWSPDGKKVVVATSKEIAIHSVEDDSLREITTV